jgi:hypothetical protein
MATLPAPTSQIGPLTILGQFCSLSLRRLPPSSRLFAPVLQPSYRKYQLTRWRNYALQRRQFNELGTVDVYVRARAMCAHGPGYSGKLVFNFETDLC